MKDRIINEIVQLKERKKLLEAIERGDRHIDIFTDDEIRDALELKRRNLLHEELNRIEILLEEDERILRSRHRRVH